MNLRRILCWVGGHNWVYYGARPARADGLVFGEWRRMCPTCGRAQRFSLGEDRWIG